jgi:ATP-dependent Lhr-like helicase
LMLEITREEALRGLVDFGRIEEMLGRVEGRIDHLQLSRITPLAAPLLLEMGRVPVEGAATERLVLQEAHRLMELAGLSQATFEGTDTPSVG